MSSFRWCIIVKTHCASKLLHTYQNVPFKRWLGTSQPKKNSENPLTLKSTTSSKAENSGINVQPSQYDDLFWGAKGFWPETVVPLADDPKSTIARHVKDRMNSSHKGTTTNEDFRSDSTPTSIDINTEELFPALKSSRRPGHRDLSYVSLEKWEALEFVPKVSSPQSSFRENAGLRRILGRFATYATQFTLESVNTTSGDDSHLNSDVGLSNIFSKSTVAFLESKGYQVEDVQAWFWILNSPSADKAVQRYVAFSTDVCYKKVGRIPLFIPLQILRSDRISVQSLSSFINEVKWNLPFEAVAHGQNNHLQINWDRTSAVLLIVRLLRHARNVAPELLETIINLVPNLFAKPVIRNKQQSQSKSNKQLPRIYNRFLSLISEPSSKRPLRSTPFQQQAQLNIMRQMIDFNPPIPVNREGYRALVRVQSAHAKTEDERAWAAVKALTWPPWRRDKLGIEEDLEYPGKESRMLKVVRRMAEAGYQEHEWEKKASILAGWDSDKSPTIQTRKILARKPMMWLAGLISNPRKSDPQPEHHIWAARITATRTIREAWASFSSYMKLSKQSQRHMAPYQAMFQKLFARVQRESEVFPGDGKEIYLDPSSSRDIVYVESEPPTVVQLYENMLSNDIKPAGRFISELIDNAESLEIGLGYIKDCSYGEVKIDVLLHPEKYPWEFILDTISSFPNHFFAAYIGLLSRPDKSSGTRLFLPGSAAEGPAYLPYESRETTALGLAFRMLEGSETRYLPAWNVFLAALPLQLRAVRLQQDHVRKSRYEAVTETKIILRYFRILIGKMEALEIPPDYLTFSYVTNVARELMTFPNLGKSLAGFSTTATKSLFLRVAYGRDVKTWLPKSQDSAVQTFPDPDTLSALINILGLSQDIPGIILLLNWMSEHFVKLKAVQEGFRSGDEAMQRTMTVARIFLEGTWSRGHAAGIDKARRATPDQLETTQQRCACFGWPSNQQVDEFLSTHKSWVRLVRWVVPNQLQWKRKGSS